MKRKTKGILFGLLLVLILLVSFLGIHIYRMIADLRKFAPLHTGEVVAGIYAVRDSYVNLYLVKGAGGYIAVDSGSSPDRVREGLRKISIDPAQVSAVFLTHGDSDHTGGLPVFRNARIYLANEEEQMVDGTTARFAFIKNKRIPPHERLNDGQVVEVEGLKVVSILTPGHTPGSSCYLVDGRYLFTGDTMRLHGGKAEIFSKAINMDSNLQRQSLKKLAALKGVEYVFTAHFGYSGFFAKVFEQFR